MLKILLWYVAMINVINCAAAPKQSLRRVLNVGVFLEDDDQFEISTLVLVSAAKIISMNTKYEINPVIVKTAKSDILDSGQTSCRLMESRISATFGPESPEINEFIQSVSTRMELPQFQTCWNSKLASFLSKRKPDKPVQTFNLYPSPQTLSRGVATLVSRNGWKTFTVIYERDDGLLRLQEVLKQRNPSDPAISFRKLGSRETHRSVLKEITNSPIRQIILDCETEHIIEILRVARDLGLLTEFYSYILTNLDAHTLDWSEFKNIKTNITTLRLVDPNSPAMDQMVHSWNNVLESSIMDIVRDPILQRELVNFKRRNPFFKINPNNIRAKTVLLHDALNLFISIFVYLDSKQEIIPKRLNCDVNETSSHGKLFSEVLLGNVKVDDLLLLEPLTPYLTEFGSNGYRKNIQLQISELNFDKFLVTATWDSTNPEEINNTLSREEMDIELKKKISQWTFRVVSRLGDPYLMKKNETFEGYVVDLMKKLCEPKALNCTFTIQLVRDGNYGKYNPQTKQWDGLIKDLLDGKADLSVGDLTITYERKRAVDFTVPFMALGISILYAKPIKPPPELLAFTNPLSLDVWLYMATAYLMISLILFLVARLNPNDWENPHPCNSNPQELENIWSLRNCCWLTLGSLMAQGCDILPKGLSTRLLTAIWWFFALIMINCYTANMTAFLTNERMGLVITSAEDLAEQNKIKYGCVDGAATAQFFKDTNFSAYHRMWVQMESADPSVFESNNKDGVKRVLSSKGSYAFIMESSTIEYETERICELMKVGNNLDSKGYGIAMPINAMYRKPINEAILKMQESGELHKLKDKWWKEMNGGGKCKKDKSATDDGSANEMGLDHVGGAFVVLAAGICLALIIAVFEFLWNVRKVALVERITPRQAFFKELKFAMDIKVRKKNVLQPTKSRAILLEKLEDKI